MCLERPVDRASTSILTLWKGPVSPAGESLSFASPKESNQRKGDPYGSGRASHDCPAMLAGAGRRGTRSLRSLRQPRRTTPAPSALLGGPKGATAGAAQRLVAFHRLNHTAMQTLAGFWVSPLGPPRSAGLFGGVGEHCLRERSDRVAQPPKSPSIAGKSR